MTSYPITPPAAQIVMVRRLIGRSFARKMLVTKRRTNRQYR